ncbi:hemin uptake protein HemP [Comamonas koreensis]|uniref:Hemin uptake protein HemP n=1 Tax=Comamonas koreensis TaxID=160825 RepID=A0AAW4XZ32_9BURK|nr:hemin uptake protein HemP [Comamonas koreensis]MCD2166263.1 hemin uptake protein HemP [Comamonas koreensis]
MQTIALPATPLAAASKSASASQGHATQSAALESSALLQGAKAVSIVHNGAIYRLQTTKLGKLILTK